MTDVKVIGSMSAWLAVWLCLLAAAPATAEIYAWSDSSGVVHYTSSRSAIPDSERDRAVVVAREWERPAPVIEEQSTEPTSEAPDRFDVEEERSFAYDAGFEAGLVEAARTSSPAAPTVLVQVVQETIDVIESPPRTVVLSSGPVLRPPAPREEFEGERVWFGPAGPPPLGAAGPAPFFARPRPARSR